MKKCILIIMFIFTSMFLFSCNNGKNSTNKEYIPADCVVTFSNQNSDKINTTPTFDISKYKENAGFSIQPYQLFRNGMCLQRDAINHIWGISYNTSYIAAEINNEVYYGTVDESGCWDIYLPKMHEGGPYKLTIISEDGRHVISDVYIGEVFLLGGQSNMEWQAWISGDVLKDLYSTPDCVNDQIRLLHIANNPEKKPTTELANFCEWKGANQESVRTYTAVGYLFGKALQEELGCPVGLISTAVGGSMIEYWLSEENYNLVKKTYTPVTNNDTVMTPCLGYNGILYPLTGINVRGVVWYQGCSNTFGTQDYYDVALSVFIKQCRQMFNNKNLTFTVCELARYKDNPYAYSIVNERINSVANNDNLVVVARNLDLGNWFDIHPLDKHEIGRRAAYETLRVFFKKDKPEPVKVKDYTFNSDGTVTINLSCNASLVNGSNGFEVYVDGKYTYNCTVSIENNKITVKADGQITKVRYGYTCLMTEEIQKDVSKMVTVYDVNGFPLDLFIISK